MSLANRSQNLKAAWDYTQGTLQGREPSRSHKTMFAFSASVVTRSPYGINLFRRELARRGVSEKGIKEVLSIVQLFEAITKVADLLRMPVEIEHKDMPNAPRTRKGDSKNGLD